MKKFGLIILGLCSIFFVGSFTHAKDYEYTNLNITANILNDGTIDVEEDFTANFFVNKHGIIRNIPLNYSVGGKNFHINISNIYVQGKKFTTSKDNGNIEIKIGDANATVVGEQSYPIFYSTYGLIRNFSGMGYAELYWNLVGYDFDTNINKVRATLILPKAYTGFTKDDFLITTDGKSKTIDGFEGSVDWSHGDRIIITYDKGLPAFQGITLAIKFPNDYFTFDHEKQQSILGDFNVSNANTSGNFNNWRSYKNSQFKSKFQDIRSGVFLFLILSIFCLPFAKLTFGFLYILFMLIFVLVNLGYKKLSSRITRRQGGSLEGDLAKKFPTIIQYTPPEGISSAEASLLIHRHAESPALTSLIYKRALEGLVSINVNFKKDEFGNDSKKIKSITIKKLGKISESAPTYEKEFFKSFLKSQNISNSGDIKINLAKLRSLEAYGRQQNRFSSMEHDKSVNNGYAVLFYVLFSFFVCLILWLDTSFYISILMLFFVAIIICIFISKITTAKNKLTESGAQILSQVLGYREFLQKCDENQIRTLLKEDPLFIDKALPYATVFGIESDLIKKISPIMNELNIKINWYDGDSDSMNNFVSSMHKYTPSTPSKTNLHSIDFGKTFSGLFDSGGSSYSSSSGFSSGSSFSGGGSSFSSGGGGGGGGGRSW